ncbi:MAG: hypothetical protein COU69_01490 [Candidatus Pacebacteria bacterium CG10_big_fil_rev_8_21_14_0_10_56_10]|nr:MAG: hypothetical protein COU69_01490 [Candidatus Pacebacteria bacterium CG10_big_fil_rev_8_21_14_0_10_56_10]
MRVSVIALLQLATIATVTSALAMTVQTVFAPPLASAQAAAPTPTDELAVPQVIEGPHFFNGQNVIITDTLEGDVYAVGGTVQLEGTIIGSLLTAGGQVTINGEVTDDVRAAGGQVSFNGAVGDNVTVLGGTVTFGPESAVGGSVVAGGSSVSMSGEVLGNTLIGGGTTRLAGTFAQNVRLGSDTVEILPGALIGGSIGGEVGTQLEIAPQATVAGQRQVRVHQLQQRADQTRRQAQRLFQTGQAAWFLVTLVMSLLGGSFLLYLFDRQAERVTQLAAAAPVAALGWGAVQLIVTPILALLLLITIFAAPLAGLILLSYLISVIIAGWVGAYVVGHRLCQQLGGTLRHHRYLQLVLGVLAVKLLGLVPLLGWVVRFLVFMVGLGLVVMVARDVTRQSSAYPLATPSDGTSRHQPNGSHRPKSSGAKRRPRL